MNNNLRNLLIGLGFFIFGVVNIILRDKLSRIPKDKDNSLYFSFEQSRNKKIILGVGFVFIGIIIMAFSISKL